MLRLRFTTGIVLILFSTCFWLRKRPAPSNITQRTSSLSVPR